MSKEIQELRNGLVKRLTTVPDKEVCIRMTSGLVTELVNIIDEHESGKMTDFYVRDKETGRIHRVGDDEHDSVWVDHDGTLHYYNLKDGDGCDAVSILDDESGYEFCPSETGSIDSEYLEAHKDDFANYLKRINQ